MVIFTKTVLPEIIIIIMQNQKDFTSKTKLFYLHIPTKTHDDSYHSNKKLLTSLV